MASISDISSPVLFTIAFLGVAQPAAITSIIAVKIRIFLNFVLLGIKGYTGILSP